MSIAKKIAYKPVGMAGGLLAGTTSGFLVRRSWAAISEEKETPDPLCLDRGFAEVVLFAALQGAVFAATGAAISRLGALGFQRTTGVWPGD
ncbi:DUF4235 domain-containing protein [Parafrankia sp. EUN1f]|uniref:DUF4235 domain-containing protein n=1 Tax=Parafrankia sp. EUN1f TaxID=102897 RepID=UPI0001C43AF2|nr:DUF4235 domain-containing protein [Parafrankia sp. EUN1f]EFC82569.1 hypothetical protein FrEUN1fDRAFT_4292 [Parafrankia sp. EUN1f]